MWQSGQFFTPIILGLRSIEYAHSGGPSGCRFRREPLSLRRQSINEWFNPGCVQDSWMPGQQPGLRESGKPWDEPATQESESSADRTSPNADLADVEVLHHHASGSGCNSAANFANVFNHPNFALPAANISAPRRCGTHHVDNPGNLRNCRDRAKSTSSCVWNFEELTMVNLNRRKFLMTRDAPPPAASLSCQLSRASDAPRQPVIPPDMLLAHVTGEAERVWPLSGIAEREPIQTAAKMSKHRNRFVREKIREMIHGYRSARRLLPQTVVAVHET